LPRKFGDKRGISPIMATLLLIVIAIAAIIVTYAWITAYISGGTHQAGASIKIENAYINSTSRNVTIHVRNTSPSGEAVTIDKVYIEGQDVTSYSYVDGDNLGDTPQTLQPKQVIEIIVVGEAAGLTFQTGHYYTIKVSGPETYWEQSVEAKE